MLGVQVPERIGNGLRAQRAILTELVQPLRENVFELVAVDPAVDHHMGDVNTLGAIIPCQRLGQAAKTGFRGGEVGEAEPQLVEEHLAEGEGGLVLGLELLDERDGAGLG